MKSSKNPPISFTTLHLLVVWSLVVLPTHLCSIGCLSCTPDSKCLLCDTSNFFFLDESSSSCTFSQIPHCIYARQPGACSFCQSGFLLSEDSASCLELPNGLSIQNCRSYDHNMKCSLCLPTYRLSDGACHFDSQRASGCASVSDETSDCVECLPGFGFDPQQNACIDRRESTCLVQRPLVCSQCQDNFFPVETDFYADLSPQSPGEVEWIARIDSALEFNFSLDAHLASIKNFSCKSTNLENCRKVTREETCAECYDPFVLDSNSGQCESPVYARIPNCAQYFGRGSCLKCESGYFKQSNDECRPVESVDHCAVYAQAFDACVQCADGFKLSGASRDNACESRSAYPIDACGRDYLRVDWTSNWEKPIINRRSSASSANPPLCSEATPHFVTN